MQKAVSENNQHKREVNKNNKRPETRLTSDIIRGLGALSPNTLRCLLELPPCSQGFGHIREVPGARVLFGRKGG